jgi:S-adenosylmethionine/arginine decarboxylase-like enzyme
MEDPPKDLKMMRKWTKNLIKDIDMKILAGPYAKYCDVKGNRGLTCVTIIETSHITLHSWDENNPALVQLDVYSCKELDETVVFDYVYKFMPVRMSYRYFDRENNFKLIKLKK